MSFASVLRYSVIYFICVKKAPEITSSIYYASFHHILVDRIWW